MPVVRTVGGGTYEIADAPRFVTQLDLTIGPGTGRELTVEYPTAGDPPRMVGLRRAGVAGGLNLLSVGSLGAFLAMHRVRVVRTTGPDTTRLTCTIANTGATVSTGGWELRAERPTPSTWQVGLGDATVGFVACDPVARVEGPGSAAENGPATLVASDASGTPDAAAVAGTLPAAWSPGYRWRSTDMPPTVSAVSTTPQVTVTLPDVPSSRTVDLVVDTTLGPDVPPFLRSTSPPAPLLIVHTDPPPTLTGLAPDRVEAGQVVEVTATGTNLLTDVRFSVPGGGVTVDVLDVTPESARLRLTADAATPPGTRVVRVDTAGGADERALLTLTPRAILTGLTPGEFRQNDRDVAETLTVTGQGLDTARGVVLTIPQAKSAGFSDVTVTRVDATSVVGRFTSFGNPDPSRPGESYQDIYRTRDLLVDVTLADGRTLRATGTVVELDWRSQT